MALLSKQISLLVSLMLMMNRQVPKSLSGQEAALLGIEKELFVYMLKQAIVYALPNQAGLLVPFYGVFQF
ncbi:hypothetical protein OK016_21610 [Vibrio chagasii]|nr:hypothetical protein [Vibrio chagasii]